MRLKHPLKLISASWSRTAYRPSDAYCAQKWQLLSQNSNLWSKCLAIFMLYRFLAVWCRTKLCLQVDTMSTNEVDFMASNLWKISWGLVYIDVCRMILNVKDGEIIVLQIFIKCLHAQNVPKCIYLYRLQFTVYTLRKKLQKLSLGQYPFKRHLYLIYLQRVHISTSKVSLST